MNQDIVNIASRILGFVGKMIGGSKSRYREQYPDHTVVFNSNIATKSHGKIWYGDVDLTLSEQLLIDLAKELGEPIYLFREMDMRFQNEGKTVDEIITSIATTYYVISHDTGVSEVEVVNVKY